MNKRRLYISAGLMVLAILAVSFFQAYWLRNTFNEEKHNLTIRTNILFRESIFETQAARFAMDTSGNINMSNRVDAIRVIDNIKARIQYDSNAKGTHTKALMLNMKTSPGAPRDFDSLMHQRADGKLWIERIELHPADSPRRFVSKSDEAEPTVVGYGRAMPDQMIRLPKDSARRNFTIARRGDAFFDVLQGVDLAQDSAFLPDVDKKFRSSLQKEIPGLQYLIERKQLDTARRRTAPPFTTTTLDNSNEVTVGFLKPAQFILHLQQVNSYLFKKIWPQILVSFLLISLTTVSFVVLYRNLVRQRKLTQLKNDFISNITHELKTPIATVSVAVEALKNFNALEDPVRTQEYLSISANELQRLSLLVDKVLKLSMFEKQEIELKPESFDIGLLINEVVSSMRLQFEKTGATVRVEMPDKPVFLSADRLHITSVVYNLLDNAIKYSKGKPQIRIGLQENGDDVDFFVEDKGEGISAEYRDRVFEKFFRVPSAGNQHNVKGYGLGLSYVAHVVDRHRGSIDLQTAPLAGSTFTIRLPRNI